MLGSSGMLSLPKLPASMQTFLLNQQRQIFNPVPVKHPAFFYHHQHHPQQTNNNNNYDFPLAAFSLTSTILKNNDALPTTMTAQNKLRPQQPVPHPPFEKTELLLLNEDEALPIAQLSPSPPPKVGNSAVQKKSSSAVVAAAVAAAAAAVAASSSSLAASSSSSSSSLVTTTTTMMNGPFCSGGGDKSQVHNHQHYHQQHQQNPENDDEKLAAAVEIVSCSCCLNKGWVKNSLSAQKKGIVVSACNGQRPCQNCIADDNGELCETRTAVNSSCQKCHGDKKKCKVVEGETYCDRCFQMNLHANCVPAPILMKGARRKDSCTTCNINSTVCKPSADNSGVCELCVRLNCECFVNTAHSCQSCVKSNQNCKYSDPEAAACDICISTGRSCWSNKKRKLESVSASAAAAVAVSTQAQTTTTTKTKKEKPAVEKMVDYKDDDSVGIDMGFGRFRNGKFRKSAKIEKPAQEDDEYNDGEDNVYFFKNGKRRKTAGGGVVIKKKTEEDVEKEEENAAVAFTNEDKNPHARPKSTINALPPQQQQQQLPSKKNTVVANQAFSQLKFLLDNMKR